MTAQAGLTHGRPTAALCPSSSTWGCNALLGGQALWSVTVFTHGFNLRDLGTRAKRISHWASPEGSDFHSNKLTHRVYPVVSRELRGCWTRPGLHSTLPSMLAHSLSMQSPILVWSWHPVAMGTQGCD